MIVSIVYLVFGLALTSMCINVVQVRNNEDLVMILICTRSRQTNNATITCYCSVIDTNGITVTRFSIACGSQTRGQ